PAGFTYVQIKADQVYFGNTVWLSATSISAKIWSPVYVDQGITIQNGISIGMHNAASPNQFAQTASIAQNGDITTQGAITAACYSTRETAILTSITAQTINTSYLNATQGIASITLTTNTITTNGTSLYIKKCSNHF
ncbi:MAG: hypothetical protein ACKPKO_35210, partial [Candidatus Fonsibacter sp.]